MSLVFRRGPGFRLVRPCSPPPTPPAHTCTERASNNQTSCFGSHSTDVTSPGGDVSQHYSLGRKAVYCCLVHGTFRRARSRTLGLQMPGPRMPNHCHHQLDHQLGPSAASQASSRRALTPAPITIWVPRTSDSPDSLCLSLRPLACMFTCAPQPEYYSR